VKDIAVVTGGSRGIGREIVRVLAGEYDVINLSRSISVIDNMPVFSSINCDISKKDDVEIAFKLISEMGRPKILINCAGTVEPKSILETTPEQWEHQLRVNLTGAFLCVREFLRYSRSGGKIINIASTAGTRPSPGWAVYGAAKAGLINFSQSLAEEMRPYGVKVYCLVPGRCATELRRKMAPDEDQSRIMQPEEVARFVRYLVAEDNILGNGQPLVLKTHRRDRP